MSDIIRGWAFGGGVINKRMEYKIGKEKKNLKSEGKEKARDIAEKWQPDLHHLGEEAQESFKHLVVLWSIFMHYHI